MTIATKLTEAGNGAILIMSVFTSAVFAMYLLKKLAETTQSGESIFYTYENKTAIAIFTFCSGISLRAGTSWLAQQLRDIGIARDSLHWLWGFYVIGTLVALWGLICLNHALMPYKWPRWSWILVAASAVSFGIYFAM